MLDDRSYMRPDYEPYGRSKLMMPLTMVLMIALIVAFALQQINRVYFHSSALVYLALSPEGLLHGYIWQLLTFQFLHADLGHIFWNLVGLWCFGRSVEDRLGKARFLTLYFLSGAAGGLLQGILGIAFPSHFGGLTYGASAGIAGLVAAFATMEPDARILYSLIIPLRAKHVLYISLAIALFFTLVPSKTDVAHAAHLGGILFGVAYIRRGIGFSQSLADWNPFRRKSQREKMIKAATIKLPRFGRQAKLVETTEVPSEEFMSKEVDPILEKISAHGIKSLTEREREILQAARARMSK